MKQKIEKHSKKIYIFESSKHLFAILTLAATPAAIWKRFLKQIYLVMSSFQF